MRVLNRRAGCLFKLFFDYSSTEVLLNQIHDTRFCLVVSFALKHNHYWKLTGEYPHYPQRKSSFGGRNILLQDLSIEVPPQFSSGTIAP